MTDTDFRVTIATGESLTRRVTLLIAPGRFDTAELFDQSVITRRSRKEFTSLVATSRLRVPHLVSVCNGSWRAVTAANIDDNGTITLLQGDAG